MISPRLKDYLDENRVPYQARVHDTAYTAQQVAAAQHVSGHKMAKTVIVNTGERLAMAVLPAPLRLDLAALRAFLGKPEARLATEAEFAALFPDSETGAMPPFGNLYNMPVLVDEVLSKDEEIVFNAGTHRDSIQMRFADFQRLVQPTIAALALHEAAA